MNGKCVIFSAPSGAGKTTIIQQLLKLPELKLEFSISATTRLPRGQEIHGKDYYFLDVDVFKKKIENGELVEWEEVYENSFYGTLHSELQRIWDKGNNVAFDIDVKGGINLKKLFGDKALAIFVIPPSAEVLEQRLRGRGTETEEKIQQRLARANYELSLASNFDVQLLNDDINRSVEEAFKKINEFFSVAE